ncbi:MAG: ABC transporter permease [Bacteroidetes bacterium]|nr:ABC transporter permease [Bacteroidota bacterium]
MERYFYNINIALEAVFANKFRSILTALGIIFGVAAVIAMLAIGNGAQQEILEQIKLVGVNNIIITPKIDDDKENEKKGNNLVKEKFSPGLTMEDAMSIKEVVPTVLKVSPEVVYETFILKDGIRKPAKITGVTPDYFEVFNLKLQDGNMFNQQHMDAGSPVCIIGPNIKSKFFSSEDPIGKFIKCGKIWLKVIGVIEDININKAKTEGLGISDYNNDIYAPIQTLFLRIKDRSLVTATKINRGESGDESSGNTDSKSSKPNFNQLDKIVAQVNETKMLNASTEIISRLIKRRHSDVEDFEIKVPELLLQQEQRTKDIFNIVLGAIASISLIVGGIGIMNIMLASVMERTKEIGVRLAIGATKKDVIFQFLSEATLISISGGIIGIIFGVLLTKGITQFFEIVTIISPISIIISFGVSATVGIVFGYMPARKAAQKDPVSSLRYE